MLNTNIFLSRIEYIVINNLNVVIRKKYYLGIIHWIEITDTNRRNKNSKLKLRRLIIYMWIFIYDFGKEAV
jgi:hypothetical protein